MLHRFYDIKFENEQLEEMALDKEYVLDVPEHDMSTPMDRLEHLGNMFDIITAASGVNVCLFSSDHQLT